MTNWTEVPAAAQMKDGQIAAGKAGTTWFAVYRIDGVYYATDNFCTHEEALLSDGWLDGCMVECPLHAGRFDVRDGKAQGDPVDVDLKTYPVKQDGGRFFVGLD